MDESRKKELMKIVFTDANPITYIKKGWGRFPDKVGEIFAYHTNQEEREINVETVKLLYMAENKKLSRHYHKNKDEFFFCVKGIFFVELWDFDGTFLHSFMLRPEERVFIPKLLQHRMTGKSHENILLEVSTKDSPDDSYRIEKGD